MKAKDGFPNWLPSFNCKNEYAQAKGFKIESKEMRDSAKPYQMHISRVDKADLPSISKLTLELKRAAAKYDGDYDGWETFVVR